MDAFAKAYHLLRCLGPRVLWLRAGVQAERRLGMTRGRFRPRAWDDIRLSDIVQPGTPTAPEPYARFKRHNSPPFLFPPGRPPRINDDIDWVTEAHRAALADAVQHVAENRCRCFFDRWSPGPIDWHANPFEDFRSDPAQPWYDIPDRTAEQGDARTLWEPSRGAWACDLARAKAHGLATQTGDIFWRWVDSWMASSPPFVGFQWKCGQEAAVRMMALSFGFWALAEDAATTADRWVQFARFAWATGYRISRHMRYALSQKNNHAISEACGLMLVSQLFPEFREASQWRRTGRRVLAAEIRRQCYDDGSYIQQSMNYHRVMLQAAILGVRLADLSGAPMDGDIYEHIGQGAEFLFEMADPQTGQVPNTGNNDGALILPLSGCDFTDFRPIIQAAHYLAHRKRLLPAGPWDEALLWMFGAKAIRNEPADPPPPESTTFERGGYYTLRQRESWAMLRCCDNGDRTAHYDQLHVDLWWRGLNVLPDCGTYQYYVPGRPDVEAYFKTAAAHNTVEIDGENPLELVSPYLFLPAMQARILRAELSGDGPLWLHAEHYDYDRKPWRVRHRRAVLAMSETLWVVVDDVLGRGEHALALRWHMLDAPTSFDTSSGDLRLDSEAGPVHIAVHAQPGPAAELDLIRGCDEPGNVQGFASPHYGRRAPIPVLQANVTGPLPRRLITLIALGQGCPTLDSIRDRIIAIIAPPDGLDRPND